MTETQTTAKATTTRHCNCGCGEATSSSKTMYKPGHDARHAGNVARAMAADYNDAGNDEKLEALPSANLKHKARMMAARLVEKAATKAERAAKTREARTSIPEDRKTATETTTGLAAVVAAEEAAHAEETATEIPEPMFEDETPAYKEISPVKVGRWEYPARQNHFGKTERNAKRDGSGEWIAYEA
ncbi:hypothetical protein KDI96_gp52 [Arthrobacter phage Gisselle]|uniref:Uncharacterized protein n=1 Tax=Arthrobacter phage Gisselle TaxID=2743905 RepID=A0AAE7F9U8_9CAUD|nr:hypothetical protein KDI96_gp52 [Arthrobacter phage Gisselle]QDH48957.1 hypothetical protein SEA_DREAMTEAM_52 [Arthrobacter phage DreamTeam]QKY79358.1 hypothetical protein SEA_GISSELLE_52 [Arthrobacter phage Gisselle]